MAKLEKTDYLYSSSRVRYLEQYLLTGEKAERMLEARSDAEAMKILSECGYQEINNAAMKELDAAINTERKRVLDLIRSFSPSPAIVDFFRIKYDYHNMKTALKGLSAEVGASDDILYSVAIDDGTVPFRTLLQILREERYSDLTPDMAKAAKDAREILNRTGDPQPADILLDKAMYAGMLQKAQEADSDFIVGYTRFSIDVANLRTIARSFRMSRSDIAPLLISGGNIDSDKIVAAAKADMGTVLREIYSSTPLKEAAEAAALAGAGKKISAFEALCDNLLMAYLIKAKKVSFGEEPLFAYLAAKEAEFITIRTIMTGRFMKVDPGEIRERLRVAYV